MRRRFPLRLHNLPQPFNRSLRPVVAIIDLGSHLKRRQDTAQCCRAGDRNLVTDLSHVVAAPSTLVVAGAARISFRLQVPPFGDQSRR